MSTTSAVRLVPDQLLGAAVNGTTDDGRTALMWASARGDTAVVTLLLHRGTAVNALDRIGRTALQLAAERHRAGVVELLKKSGGVVLG